MMKGIVLLCVLFAGLSEGKYNLTVGPKKNETGTYLYKTVNGMEHCRVCSMRAITDSYYKREQQTLCFNNSKNISRGEKKMFPICRVGDAPGCGGLPNVTHDNNQHWYCDSGYSFQNYSVYFSCALICNITDKVIKSYYCNEGLNWEVDFLGQSQHECQVPGNAPEPDNLLVYLIVGLGSTVAVIVIVILCSCLCCKVNCLKKILSRENLVPSEQQEMVPLNRRPEDVGLNIERDQEVDAVEPEDGSRLPLNPPNNSLNSSRNSRDASVGTESNSISSNSLGTRHHINNTTVKPSIKIMTSKNNTSQTSVPIQSGSYSIEEGSDYFVMPDSPDGIGVTEFTVDCKTNGRSFRGERCNTFMYQVSNVKASDEDFYRWKIKLDNGTVHQGTFQIYVSIPEMASVHRNAPEGEENASGVVTQNRNNQQVRAEVYNDANMSYIPLSNEMFSDNHPARNTDSGLSSRSSHSQRSNHANMPLGRIEDTRYSTSGYCTDPSVGISEILGNAEHLNPDTISVPLSSTYGSNGHDQEPVSRSIDRPSPQGHLAEVRYEDEMYNAHGGNDFGNDDDDDDDEHQTASKQYWENYNVDETEVCRSEDILPHGEIEYQHSHRPIINTPPGRDVHSPVLAEEFDRKVQSALQLLANNPSHSNDDDGCVSESKNDESKSSSSLVRNGGQSNDGQVEVEIPSPLSTCIPKDDTSSKNNSLSNSVNTQSGIGLENESISKNNSTENLQELELATGNVLSEINTKNHSAKEKGRKSALDDSSS
ncbi:hypothetical protein ACF0H5_010905 [Mactra antiquata]